MLSQKEKKGLAFYENDNSIEYYYFVNKLKNGIN